MIKIQNFFDSINWMGDPENPNFEYPPGHFIPFPLSIVELEVKANIPLTVTFDIHN